MSEDEQPQAQNGDDKKVVSTQKVYLKDVSFESPNSPALFTKKWEPKLGVEIDTSFKTIGDDIYEIILIVTATATVEDKTAFLTEVHQAGIFLLKGHEPDTLLRMQHVFCLSTLYPYACAALSDLVTKGGFPQLLLTPMNFAALYAKRLKNDTDQNETSE